MNASAGWSARPGHSSVVMPDGSIVLMGGSLSTGGYSERCVAVHGYGQRGHGDCKCWVVGKIWSYSVAMPDGSIVLMGGYDVRSIRMMCGDLRITVQRGHS